MHLTPVLIPLATSTVAYPEPGSNSFCGLWASVDLLNTIPQAPPHEPVNQMDGTCGSLALNAPFTNVPALEGEGLKVTCIAQDGSHVPISMGEAGQVLTAVPPNLNRSASIGILWARCKTLRITAHVPHPTYAAISPLRTSPLLNLKMSFGTHACNAVSAFHVSVPAARAGFHKRFRILVTEGPAVYPMGPVELAMDGYEDGQVVAEINMDGMETEAEGQGHGVGMAGVGEPAVFLTEFKVGICELEVEME